MGSAAFGSVPVGKKPNASPSLSTNRGIFLYAHKYVWTAIAHWLIGLFSAKLRSLFSEPCKFSPLGGGKECAVGDVCWIRVRRS